MTDVEQGPGILNGRAPTSDWVKYVLGLLAAMLLAQIAMFAFLDQMGVLSTHLEAPSVSKVVMDLVIGSAVMTVAPALGALVWSYAPGRTAESGRGFLQASLGSTAWYAMGLAGTMLLAQALLIGVMQWLGMAYDPTTYSPFELWVVVIGGIVMFTLAPVVGAVSWWWYNE